MPISDMAGELWLLLISLAGKIHCVKELITRIGKEENREMIDHFIQSGYRLIRSLEKLLQVCEKTMSKACKKSKRQTSAQDAGTEFVNAMFGRDGQLEITEKFMSSVRLWIFEYDNQCGDIMRRLRMYE